VKQTRHRKTKTLLSHSFMESKNVDFMETERRMAVMRLGNWDVD
jgi:hypothetical protein